MSHSQNLPTRVLVAMKLSTPNYLAIAPVVGAAILVLTGCDVRTTTAPPTVEKHETTIVNPPAEKKVENNTTIVNPPAEKKVETNTTIVK